MDDLTPQEIRALADVLASVEITEEVRELLGRLEAGEIGVREVVVAPDETNVHASCLQNVCKLDF